MIALTAEGANVTEEPAPHVQSACERLCAPTLDAFPPDCDRGVGGVGGDVV